jgi:hypothetical protein
MLIKLCKELIRYHKIPEARVICRKYMLCMDEINITEHIEEDKKVHDSIFNIDGNIDFEFGPLSNPKDEYIKLPDNVEYTFVDTEVDNFENKLRKLYK